MPWTATSGVDRVTADPYHDEPGVAPSPRSFGLLFAVVFAGAGVWPWWYGQPVRIWAIAAAGALGLAAAMTPHWLAPLSRVWNRLGLAMHRVVNPILMGALYFLVVTPFGLVRQLTNRGLTPQLRREPRAATYWISRSDRSATAMDHQF